MLRKKKSSSYVYAVSFSVLYSLQRYRSPFILLWNLPHNLNIGLVKRKYLERFLLLRPLFQAIITQATTLAVASAQCLVQWYQTSTNYQKQRCKSRFLTSTHRNQKRLMSMFSPLFPFKFQNQIRRDMIKTKLLKSAQFKLE